MAGATTGGDPDKRNRHATPCPGHDGWTKLTGYQAQWDPKIDLGKFYFTTFQGKREETPYMTADNFARTIYILRNEDPVYRSASTGSVTRQGEPVGDAE